MKRSLQEKVNQHQVPTVLVRGGDLCRSVDKGKKELKLSLQLRETAQQRCLMNYHNYLKSWDKYEKRVQRHFEYKELAKF